MSSCTQETMINLHGNGIWAGIGETLHLWRQRYRAREELSRLSERDLHDLGLSFGDIAHESGKPFWRA